MIKRRDARRDVPVIGRDEEEELEESTAKLAKSLEMDKGDGGKDSLSNIVRDLTKPIEYEQIDFNALYDSEF